MGAKNSVPRAAVSAACSMDVRALVNHLSQGDEATRAFALDNLTSTDATVERAVECGAMPALVQHIARSKKTETLVEALEVLAHVCEEDQAVKQLGADAGAIEALVELIRGSPHEKVLRRAIRALDAFCHRNSGHGKRAAAAGAVELLQQIIDGNKPEGVVPAAKTLLRHIQQAK
jgi:hypothetical protein